MSQNSSREIKSDRTESTKSRRSQLRTWLTAIMLPAWVLVSFLLAQQLVVGLVSILRSAQIPFEQVNESVLTTILAALIYVLTIVLVIGVPRLTKIQRVSREDIGLSRLPIWKDIVAAPIGLVVYVIVSALLILLATSLLVSFDANEAQDTGFAGSGLLEQGENLAHAGSGTHHFAERSLVDQVALQDALLGEVWAN